MLLLKHLELILDIVTDKLTRWALFAQGNTLANDVQRHILCVECSLDLDHDGLVKIAVSDTQGDYRIVLTEESRMVLVNLLSVPVEETPMSSRWCKGGFYYLDKSKATRSRSLSLHWRAEFDPSNRCCLICYAHDAAQACYNSERNIHWCRIVSGHPLHGCEQRRSPRCMHDP